MCAEYLAAEWLNIVQLLTEVVQRYLSTKLVKYPSNINYLAVFKSSAGLVNIIEESGKNFGCDEDRRYMLSRGKY